MREIMRSLLSANLTVTGILMFIGSLIVFTGSVYLINSTNLGRRLGFLITGAATFGWGVINSILFILYAPRGPKPADIEGLNAFEIRILPITFMVASLILFIMFLLALNRFEEEQLEEQSS
jgi:amino acid transporter